METVNSKEYVPSQEALELLKLLRPMDDDFMRVFSATIFHWHRWYW